MSGSNETSDIGPVIVRYKRLPNSGLLAAPAYKSSGASAFDLYAALAGRDIGEITLNPGEMQAFPTGICVEIPPGYEGQVRGRSGLAKDYRVSIEQGVGTIDSDFRGEIHVLLKNSGKVPVTIEHGNRIAQLVIAPVVQVDLREVENLNETVRGERGFGSSGR